MQPGVGRVLGQLGGNRPAEHLLSVVGGVQDELAGRGRRIEPGACGEQSLDIGHDHRQPRLELGAQRRQLVMVPDADEQVVLELVPQPLERCGQGGLAALEHLGGAGDALLAEERVECDQQVEVEVEEVDVLARQV